MLRLFNLPRKITDGHTLFDVVAYYMINFSSFDFLMKQMESSLFI